MPAKKLPSSVLKMTGSYRKKPEVIAEREAEEEYESSWPPLDTRVPTGFTAKEKRAWIHLLKSAPEGHFTAGDRISLECAARCLAGIRMIEHEAVAGDPDALKALNPLHSRLQGYLKMLGLEKGNVRTPAPIKKAAREKAKAEKGKKADVKSIGFDQL